LDKGAVALVVMDAVTAVNGESIINRTPDGMGFVRA
jgi:hypothetical protein